MKISIYGDSIMKGAVLEGDGRYKAVMGENIEAFERDFGVSVVNRSRFGSTITRGAELLQRDLQKGTDCTHALLEFGGNDCNFNWGQVSESPEADHQPLTPLAQFENAFRAMVLALKGRGIIPVAMTLPPIDAEKYLGHIAKTADPRRVLQWLGDVNMIYRFHELYSSTISVLAREAGILLIDARKRFLGDHRFASFIGDDGIHLNRAGYSNLAGILGDFTAGRLGQQGAAAI